jgi:hypothetical protein
MRIADHRVAARHSRRRANPSILTEGIAHLWDKLKLVGLGRHEWHFYILSINDISVLQRHIDTFFRWIKTETIKCLASDHRPFSDEATTEFRETRLGLTRTKPAHRLPAPSFTGTSRYHVSQITIRSMFGILNHSAAAALSLLSHIL